MKEGLLWFDDSPSRELADKVKQAAARYKARLRRKPTVCYLNTEQFNDKIIKVNGITLKPANHIRPHYLWIGVDRNRRSAKSA